MVRGCAIVTDLEFWKSSTDWPANESFLQSHGALIVEGINIFYVAKGMPDSVEFRRIGLVVVGFVFLGLCIDFEWKSWFC